MHGCPPFMGKAFVWDPGVPGCPSGTQHRVGETYLPQSTLFICVQEGVVVCQAVVKPKAFLLTPPPKPQPLDLEQRHRECYCC